MNQLNDIKNLKTEAINKNTTQIDQLSSLEFVKLVNKEDQAVIDAIAAAQNDIAAALDIIATQLHQGGRLIYGGAGTSGRLGILDASECPPTYGSDPSLVQGIIAGGDIAILKAVEGAEDDAQAGEESLKNIGFSAMDVFVSIAASGRTPWGIGAMKYAKSLGAKVISLTSNPSATMHQYADVNIVTDVGPEVITGSTRMKSGSAHKMVLNMLSTGAMIQLGKVFGNLMVDMQATNEKLLHRAHNIVMQATKCEYAQAHQALENAQGSCKIAIVSILNNISASDAQTLLNKNKGIIKDCL